MSREVETVSPESTLGEAIQKMKTRRIRRLVVISSTGEVAGVVTHGDLVNAYPHHVNPFSPLGPDDPASAGKIHSIMRHPTFTIDENEPIEHAATLMSQNHIGGLPVTHLGKLVGVITESDIFRTFTKLLMGSGKSVRITFDTTENENILPFLARTIPKYQLALLSFISFHTEGKRIAVARVRGEQYQKLIEELWSSGHQVADIVKYDDRTPLGSI